MDIWHNSIISISRPTDQHGINVVPSKKSGRNSSEQRTNISLVGDCLQQSAVLLFTPNRIISYACSGVVKLLCNFFIALLNLKILFAPPLSVGARLRLSPRKYRTLQNSGFVRYSFAPAVPGERYPGRKARSYTLTYSTRLRARRVASSARARRSLGVL